MWSDFDPTPDGIVVTLPPTKTARVAIGKVQGLEHPTGCLCPSHRNVGRAPELNSSGDVIGAELDSAGRLVSLEPVCPVALFSNAQHRVAEVLEVPVALIPPQLPVEATYWRLKEIPAGMNVVKCKTGVSVFDGSEWSDTPIHIITAVRSTLVVASRA